MNMVQNELDFVFSYLDEILIASPDEESHQKHVRAIHERQNEYGLCINVIKCKFGQTKVVFLR